MGRVRPLTWTLALAAASVLLTAPARAEGPVDAYYAQQLTWSTCGSGQCATLTVPRDYANPSAGDAWPSRIDDERALTGRARMWDPAE